MGDAGTRPDLSGAADCPTARLAALVTGRFPRRATVGDLRNLHHRDLADHHQYRGRYPQHPAGLSQRGRSVAAQPVRILRKDHGAVGSSLHLHGIAHRYRPVVARHRCRGNADRWRRHRLLHLGCVEFLAHLRNHRRTRLCRIGRFRSRPHRRRHRFHRNPRHCGQLRTASMIPYCKIDHVDKSFTRGTNETRVLKDITFEVTKGEYVSIIGHSGCGKSTLLNIVAGLRPPTAGGVILEGHEVNEPGPDRAVVFQNHSLLPWLTVYDNVKLAVDKVFRSSKSRAERRDWTMHNLDLVQMTHARSKRPAEISGGMKQRVGIARALAVEPKLLLLDEPFGALDALTRAHLQDELMGIVAKTGSTVVMVTHDVDEAVLLSDRIVMMTNGPAATIGGIVEVGLERPRERVALAHDPLYMG